VTAPGVARLARWGEVVGIERRTAIDERDDVIELRRGSAAPSARLAPDRPAIAAVRGGVIDPGH